MDRAKTVGVASAEVDFNSCQLDVTQVDIRHLAAVGQVSDSPDGTYSASGKISYVVDSKDETRQGSAASDPAQVEVSRAVGVSNFRRVNIRNRPGEEAQIHALLDCPDADRIGGLSWYLLVTKQGKRYVVAHAGGGLAYMHREVLGVSGRITVDHKNGDTLDNRRENLRVATSGQQRANSKRRCDSASRFKGVRVHKGRWIARIKRIHLGSFATEEEAARAYDRAAVLEFGEFALLNFPDRTLSEMKPEGREASASH